MQHLFKNRVQRAFWCEIKQNKLLSLFVFSVGTFLKTWHFSILLRIMWRILNSLNKRESTHMVFQSLSIYPKNLLSIKRLQSFCPTGNLELIAIWLLAKVPQRQAQGRGLQSACHPSTSLENQMFLFDQIRHHHSVTFSEFYFIVKSFTFIKCSYKN